MGFVGESVGAMNSCNIVIVLVRGRGRGEREDAHLCFDLATTTIFFGLEAL